MTGQTSLPAKQKVFLKVLGISLSSFSSCGSAYLVVFDPKTPLGVSQSFPAVLTVSTCCHCVELCEFFTDFRYELLVTYVAYLDFLPSLGSASL